MNRGHTQQMSVEELHGVFQFTDDLFDDAAPVERIFTVDKTYTPRQIYPGWFESGTASIPNVQVAKTPIDCIEYLLPELYRRGEYERCLTLALERIEIYRSTAGIVRDAAETAALCLLKLKRPEEALPLLPLLKGVEEPGRLIVSIRIYFECRRFGECAQECREFLKLRPGDYFISMRLAECILRTEDYTGSNKDEVDSLLLFAESTLKSYLEQVKLGGLFEKYRRDLEYLESIKKMMT